MDCIWDLNNKKIILLLHLQIPRVFPLQRYPQKSVSPNQSVVLKISIQLIWGTFWCFSGT
jgi:hypothetical protein